jgi:hypothetical protein
LTSRDFCFWLQGFFEVGLAPDQPLTLAQIDVVRRHLNLVFVHEIDPSMGPPPKQKALTKIHAGSVVPDGKTLIRIDPSMGPPPKQKALTKIHAGSVVPDGKTLIRC